MTTNHFMIAAILATVSPVTALRAPADCIEDGTTATVSFEDSLISEGIPVGATLVDDTARAFESDPLSPDDSMGEGSVTEHEGGDNGHVEGDLTLSFPVENKGGNLSGPNGDVQNGGVEGACIEVYMKVKIRFKETVCVSGGVSGAIGGIGGNVGSNTCVEVWKFKWVRTDDKKEVCPC